MDDREGWLIDALIQGLRDMEPRTALLSIAGVLLVCGLGFPMPEDIVLITTGFLASLGKFPLWVGIVLGMAGVLSGDAVLFFLGRRYGDHVLDAPFVRRIMRPAALQAAKERVLRNARVICFAARFLPGLRSPIYLMAGAMGVPPRTYMVQDFLAASVSVPVWVVAGWYFGEQIEQAMLWSRQFQTWLFITLGVALVVWVGWKLWTRRRAKIAP